MYEDTKTAVCQPSERAFEGLQLFRLGKEGARKQEPLRKSVVKNGNGFRREVNLLRLGLPEKAKRIHHGVIQSLHFSIGVASGGVVGDEGEVTKRPLYINTTCRLKS